MLQEAKRRVQVDTRDRQIKIERLNSLYPGMAVIKRINQIQGEFFQGVVLSSAFTSDNEQTSINEGNQILVEMIRVAGQSGIEIYVGWRFDRLEPEQQILAAKAMLNKACVAYQTDKLELIRRAHGPIAQSLGEVISRLNNRGYSDYDHPFKAVHDSNTISSAENIIEEHFKQFQAS
jgi:hypothetical protein